MAQAPGYQLTEGDKALIRGMNVAFTGHNPFTNRVERRLESNIAALHFDGPVLAGMIRAHVEITEMKHRMAGR